MTNMEFFRQDIRDNLSIKNTPLLFLTYDEKDPLTVSYIIDLYLKAIDNINNINFGLAFDDDGAVQRFFSKNGDAINIEERIKPILRITQHALKKSKNIFVAICAEELSPYGYDLTDGIFLAKSLEELGVKDLLVSCGSRSFPPLWERRATSMKGEKEAFIDNQSYLASAFMLKEHLTKARIWVPEFANGPCVNYRM